MTNYKALGTTNDVTTCDCCGKQGLRMTVIMGVLDGDGAVITEEHFGTHCAALAAGTTDSRILNAARDEDIKVAKANERALGLAATYRRLTSDADGRFKFFMDLNARLRRRGIVGRSPLFVRSGGQIEALTRWADALEKGGWGMIREDASSEFSLGLPHWVVA